MAIYTENPPFRLYYIINNQKAQACKEIFSLPLKAEQTAPTFPRKEIPAASRKVEKKIRVSIVFKIGCFPLPFPSVREKFGRFCGKDRAEKVYSHALFGYVSGVYGRKGNGKRFDIKILLLGVFERRTLRLRPLFVGRFKKYSARSDGNPNKNYRQRRSRSARRILSKIPCGVFLPSIVTMRAGFSDASFL